jgi:hypothetical protein
MSRIVGCGSGLSGDRSPPGAPPRARFGESTPLLSSSRASWDVASSGVTRNLPLSAVRRAPRRPVIDTGRAVSGAAWERGYEPRPQAPHPPRQLAVTGDVPSWAGSVYVTGTVTIVNRTVTSISASSPPGSTRWSMLRCSDEDLSVSPGKPSCRMDCRIKSGNDECAVVNPQRLRYWSTRSSIGADAGDAALTALPAPDSPL